MQASLLIIYTGRRRLVCACICILGITSPTENSRYFMVGSERYSFAYGYLWPPVTAVSCTEFSLAAVNGT